MQSHPSAEVLTYYATPGQMSSANGFAETVSDLPDDVHSLAEIIQGLVIHQFAATPFYGVRVSESRLNEAHIRPFDGLLKAISNRSAAPFRDPRKPEDRLVGVCHHFAKLLTGILRVKKVPARMRYGFGAYFHPGFYEDHSVCEYWNASALRWQIVDPQFDDVWKQRLGITHDIYDVPRDQFFTPARAWTMFRNGKHDAAAFGIFQGNLRGSWFIASNLVRDAAALNKMEMLQWDTWTGMPGVGKELKDTAELAFFDNLAQLTDDPDASFTQLQQRYAERKSPIQVPDRVFNAVTQTVEIV